MADSPSHNLPGVEDVMSVGTRISWGAIFAGGILALALQFLFTLLGSAVGLSINNRMSAENLHTATIAWALFTLCLSLFIGGLVISQFTVGENKVEAALYGIIMWGLLLAMILGLGTVGVSAGFSSLVGMANMADSASTQNWETDAERAGVHRSKIDEWRSSVTEQVRGDNNQAGASEQTTRITWYVFLGTWVSMMAAAAGAFVGAGPTFKLVPVRPVI
jgi:hypothetical protein